MFVKSVKVFIVLAVAFLSRNAFANPFDLYQTILTDKNQTETIIHVAFQEAPVKDFPEKKSSLKIPELKTILPYSKLYADVDLKNYAKFFVSKIFPVSSGDIDVAGEFPQNFVEGMVFPKISQIYFTKLCHNQTGIFNVCNPTPKTNIHIYNYSNFRYYLSQELIHYSGNLGAAAMLILDVDSPATGVSASITLSTDAVSDYIYVPDLAAGLSDSRCTL